MLVPFWGPVSTKFKAPIEHSRPKGGGVAAFKLEEVAGKWQLTPAWLSRDMDLAEETVIANGIVFAYSSGVDGTQVVQDRRMERARWTEIRRCPFQRRGAAHSQLSQSDALRPRRSDRQGTLEQRRHDYVVESLQRHHRRERPRLHRHLGRDALRLWRQVGRGWKCARTDCLLLVAVLIAGGVTFAQVGRGWSDWPTPYADAQRTSWLRTDPKISVESMSKPGFDLQWTSKLDNQRRGLQGFTQGVTASGVTLFVPTSIVAGSSNNLFMLDNDTGYVVWSRTFEGPLPASTAACSGGITAAPTRIVSGAAEPTPPAGPATAPPPAEAISGLSQRARRAWPGHSRRGSRRRARSCGGPARQWRAPGRGGAPGRASGRRVFPARQTSVAEASAARWSATRSPAMVNCTLSDSNPARTCRNQRHSSRPTRSGRTRSRSAP